MFGSLSNIDIGGQQPDFNHCNTRISKTPAADKHDFINISNNYEKCINNTLAKEFSKLSLNSPPLTPYTYSAGPARTRSRRKGRRRKKRLSITLSTKKDLLPLQICRVAESLIEDNASVYFLENRQFIFEA